MTNKELYNEIRARRIVPIQSALANLYLPLEIAKNLKGVQFSHIGLGYKIYFTGEVLLTRRRLRLEWDFEV